MYKDPADLINDVIDGVSSRLLSQQTSLVNKIVPRVIGFEQGTFGDLKNIDRTLIDKVIAKVPVEVVEEFECRLAEAVEKVLTNTPTRILKPITDRVIDILLDRIEVNLSSALYDKFETAASLAIEKQLKRKYPIWFVIDQLDQANNNTK